MTFLAAAMVLAVPVAVLVVLLVAVDRRQRRRDAVIARQVAVTDAIHAELGAIVAPLVRRTRGGWRVELPMEANDANTSLAVAIAARTMGNARPVDIVIVSPVAARMRHTAALSRPALAGARGTR